MDRRCGPYPCARKQNTRWRLPFLWPGSGISASGPQWVVAAEAIETSRRYLRTVARIDPRWIEPLAEHLVKRSYSDPYWSRKRGSVLASEKVTLFGLTVVAGRRVAYGKIDARISRQLFLEEGLVGNNVAMKAEFFRHNRRVIEDLAALAAKTTKVEITWDQVR